MDVLDQFSKKEIDYWEKVTRHDGPSNTNVWRNYCDRINTNLLNAWISKKFPFGKLLKTDLHEEVTGKGLYHSLHDKVAFVAGIDIGYTPVQEAIYQNSGLKGICADIRKLPFQDETFNAIVSTSTLDHFNTQQEIYAGLKEIQRVLKPKGELILTLDNPLNPLVWIRNKLPFATLNRLGIVPYFVGTTLGPSKIEDFLSRLNMKVVKHAAVMHSPRVVAVFVSAWVERFLNRKAQHRLLRLFLSFEAMASWPTRYRTGYFLAIKAIKNYSGMG